MRASQQSGPSEQSAALGRDTMVRVRIGRLRGAQEVLRQAEQALLTAWRCDKSKRRAPLYRLHAFDCAGEIARLDRAIAGEVV